MARRPGRWCTISSSRRQGGKEARRQGGKAKAKAPRRFPGGFFFATLPPCHLASEQSHWSDLNRRPLDYESRALPLSYSGEPMPWRGFEPRRLSALPPQDSVSTSFTTRARATE